MLVKNNNDIRIAIIAAISVAACLLVFMDWPSVDIVLGTALIAAIIIAIIVVIKPEPIRDKEIVIIAILALFMMIALPIGNVPDEPTHLQRIYSISTGQIFPSTGVVEIPENLVSEIGPYTTIFGVKDITDKTLSEDVVKLGVSSATGIYPIINYIPQIAMVSVSRLITDNRIVILYSARVGSWLVSMIMLFYAFHYLPYGKMELLVISILPGSLQGLAGASADGMAFSAVSLLISYVLYLRETRVKINTILLIILSTVVVNLKFMYFPMVFLISAVPKECFKFKKSTSLLWIFFVSFLSVILWGAISLNYLGLGTHIGSSIDTVEKILFIFKHPITFAITIIRSIYEYFWEYFCMIAGLTLGYYNIHISPTIVFTFTIFILTVLLHGNKVSPNIRVMSICIVLSEIVIFVMLWIDCTPVDSKTVIGVQGRYFIPLLFPMFLCFKVHENSKRQYNWEFFAVICADTLAVASVLEQRLY